MACRKHEVELLHCVASQPVLIRFPAVLVRRETISPWKSMVRYSPRVATTEGKSAHAWTGCATASYGVPAAIELPVHVKPYLRRRTLQSVTRLVVVEERKPSATHLAHADLNGGAISGQSDLVEPGKRDVHAGGGRESHIASVAAAVHGKRRARLSNQPNLAPMKTEVNLDSHSSTTWPMHDGWRPGGLG